MTNGQVIEEFGDFSEEAQEKAKNLLESSIKLLNRWVTGDVWGLSIETPEGEEVYACWGFYGLDCAEEEEGQSVINCLNSELKKENDYQNYLETIS